MKVIHLSSEAKPFAESGGLADVCEGLTQALADAGHDITLIIPAYKCILENPRFKVERFTQFDQQLSGNENLVVTVYQLLSSSKVKVFFVATGNVFDREGLYGYAGAEYPDSGRRFAFFTRACVSLIEREHLNPDLIHCHDWQTGLAPLFLKKSSLARVPTLFTIHNLAYQGSYDKELVPELGIDWMDFHPMGCEHFGRLNFLKSGIAYASHISTVSPTYSLEIQSSEHGMGLESFIRERSASLSGILNGIDPSYWNPANNDAFPHAFDTHNLNNKSLNKAWLQQQCAIAQRGDAPLFAFVGRLVQQKGLDLIIPVLWELLQEDCQAIFLGVGDANICLELEKLKGVYPDNLALDFSFNRETSKLIYAASDFLLMPSLFEPCGISQMIALRYGTIPIVKETGGLKDSIVDVEEHPDRGYGFKFPKHNAVSLYKKTRSARDFFHDKLKWEQLQQKAMGLNFSWQKVSKEYESLYNRLLTES